MVVDEVEVGDITERWQAGGGREGEGCSCVGSSSSSRQSCLLTCNAAVAVVVVDDVANY